MKNNLLLGLILTTSFIIQAQETSNNSSTMAKAGEWMKKAEALFFENKGQVFNLSDNTPNTSVRFMLEQAGMKLFLMETGMAIQFEKWHYPEGYLDLIAEFGPSDENEEKLRRLQKEVRLETWRVDMSLLGANPNALVTTEGKSADYVNYYNRNTLDVHSYKKVVYHDIYPNIDWVFYSTEEGLKYDFVVHPGGDPSKIKMMYSDQESLALDEGGNLQLGTSLGTYSELAPFSFQGGVSVATSFVKEGNVCSFNIEEYDRSKTLVIDPLMRVWGTYYGGTAQDYAYATVTDQNNNVYMAGRTDTPIIFAYNGHQSTYGAGTDAFLVKFDSNGNRIWATYYGGGGGDICFSVDTDASGNIFMAGTTYSFDNISYNGYQNSFGLGVSDAFLVKFNSDGVRQWGTYYGGLLASGSGGGGDDRGTSVAVDASGNVFLSGQTNSTSSIAFNGFQNSVGGGYDAFLVKFNASGVRQWATYFGGTLFDGSSSVSIDGSGNVYIAGNTLSTSSISSGGHQNTIGGMQDAFLVKFNSSGLRQWSTYYGGSADEICNYSCTDIFNNVYICGRTYSSNQIALNGHQNSKNGQSDAFLVKFNSSGVRQWGTYYGGSTFLSGSPTTMGLSSVTDGIGNVYLAGHTNTTDGIAVNGFQNTYSDSFDAFIVKFNESGLRLWGTYYGGSYGEWGQSVCLDNSGSTYLTGLTSSSDNIAYNGFQNAMLSPTSNDAYLVKFTECMPTDFIINQASCGSFTLNSTVYTTSGTFTQTLTNVAGCDSTITLNLTIHPLPTINAGNDQAVCLGTPVTLTGSGADTYTWNNGVQNGIPFVPTAGNSYIVTGTNSSTGCSNTDVAVVTVNPLPAATITPAGATTFCQGASVVLNANTGSGLTYQWKNNGTNISGAMAASYTATITGSYTVVVTNSNNCSATSTVLSITVNPLPTATITPAGATTFCQGASVVLNANTGTGLTYQWKDNGTNISGATAASYTATAAGSYAVVVTNSNSCSATSTALSITVNPLPIVDAGNPQTVCAGAMISLSGTGADTYVWDNNLSDGVPFSASATTNYIVTGTNSTTSCSNSDAVLITVNTLPNVTAGSDQSVCTGDQITLTGSGASSYAWDNGVVDGIAFTEQGTQTYTVTGTDGNNCSNSDQVIVTVNSLPIINAGADQVVCEGDPVTLSASGGSTYNWNNGVTNGAAFTPTHFGDLTYTVTGTDANNCANTDEVVLTVNEHSTATQAASGLDSYTWTVNGQTYTHSGTYIAVIPNAAGCDSTITLNLTLSFTGITENAIISFTVYPNPTNDLLNVIMPSESNEAFIALDSRGRKVLEGKLTGTETQISLRTLTPGAYMLQIGEDKIPIRVIKQ